MKDNLNIAIDGISFAYTSSNDMLNQQINDFCFDDYRIFFSLSHGGSWNVEGREYVLSPGSLIFVAPFTCHHIEFDSESDIECYSLHFSKESVFGEVVCLLEKMFSEDEINCRFYSPNKIDIQISELFRRFAFVNQLSGDEQKIYLKSLVSEAVIILSSIKIDTTEEESNCLGARVVRYLNNHIEKSISLDKLARRFFVSKYHLCRAFKEYSGISVHSYINYKRIMYAKQLISSGRNASEVAETVGFGDYSAFYRAYLRIVGKSPTSD